MKVILITSTALRHAAVAHRLAEKHDVAAVVRQQKDVFAYYRGDEGLSLIEKHFARLGEEEAKFFGSRPWDAYRGRVKPVAWGALNSPEVAALLEETNPDAVVVFGCEIIRSPLLELLPEGRTFNLHQGLSPYYRGSGTNFWPFVEGRLEFIGVTLHLIDAGIDTGDIVAHERPEIERGDTQHSLGCKTVVKSAEVLLNALDIVERGDYLHHIPQWQKGKLCRNSDLTTEAVLKVREREEQGCVDDFVGMREKGLVPPLQLIRLEK